MIFLRPWAFLLLLIPFFFLYKGYKNGYFQSPWKHVLDAHLMPHLMVQKNNQGLSKKTISFLCALWVWLTFAAAGPAFYKTTVETASSQNGLVVVLDMSPAMSEQKLFTTKLKLFDLLKSQKEDLIGLVLTDQYAYTALPITPDKTLFQNIIPTISRETIPILGSNPASGVNQAVQLLKQSNLKNGRILLITGGLVEPNSLNQVIKKSPYPVSILGIGTNEKLPADIGNGNFWKQSDGTPYLTTLAADTLSKNSRFSYHSLDNADLKYLLPEHPVSDLQKSNDTIEIYQDIGIYMLLPALLLVAFAFKPGILWSLFFFILLSENVYASSPFFRKEQENYLTQVKAVNAYRNGLYEQAAALFSLDPSADGFYNTGNSLANLGQIDKAIAAYEEALLLNPSHKDARFNLEYLKKQKNQDPSQNLKNNQNLDPSQNTNSSESSQNSQINQPSQQQNNNKEDPQNNPSAQQKEQNSPYPQKSPQPNENNSDNNPPHNSSQSSEKKTSPSKQETNQKEQTSSSQDKNSSVQNSSDDSLSYEGKSVTQDMQQQQEWLDRVQSDPGRVLKYRLYRQYKEKLK